MKKLFVLLLASLFIFAACSNGNSKPDELEQTPASTSTETSTSSSTGGGTYFGTKAPTETKAVGDIVFNDGSATPYTKQLTLSNEQKAAAIAIIFYKGTGLNSGDDTTTTRTLGVGLKHNRTGLAWCTRDANAYNVNISTITDSDKNGSDNLEQIAIFLTNSSDDTETAANYPAFYFAKNYSSTATNLGTTYANGWYLPSITELEKIYVNGKGNSKVFDIDAASTLCNGDKFSTSWFWSSSQYASGDDGAYGLVFATGAWNGNDKGFTIDNGALAVCAIRAFN